MESFHITKLLELMEIAIAEGQTPIAIQIAITLGQIGVSKSTNIALPLETVNIPYNDDDNADLYEGDNDLYSETKHATLDIQKNAEINKKET
jgi:hypothetical protein